MPSEKTIKKHAIEKLKEEGWTCWSPAKVKFQETDIWSIFDICCWRGGKMLFLQITSVSNVRARERKIRNFMEANKLKKPSGSKIEVWGYKRGEFKIIKF